MKRDHLSECDCCGLRVPSFLFNVRHRGIYRRLCTACVLKNHPGSFCPICFDVFHDNPPPSHLRVMCLHCPSISHHSCLVGCTPPNAPTSSPSYRCPPCSNPNFSFFEISKSDKKIKTNERVPAELGKAINMVLAKQMVAAAKIAVASMNKGAAAARLEAEKRVKEAAMARKRAKESLERVASLLSKENMDSKSTTWPQKMMSTVDSLCMGADKLIQYQTQSTNNVLSNNLVSVSEIDGPIHGRKGEESNGLHPVTRG